MARTSLRAYLRDIEELIETHQFDQAIAHCRHILRFYPKEVSTYRLLGKAYLESQRYGDASDIFIRVLSTIPDDFVSHVGMSIIREDEGNLDEAIWHMQRAFETQPANSAIQGELRRLHGRREGIEPPKIRLTRGALARMYLKGELYSQALAELRAGLHEDPKRYDLQVVLAQAYYLAGQRVDAAEACSSLLKSLPYCLEANKILADILSHSERADEAQVYKNRVQVLDPYMAHLSPTAPTAEKVADSAVLLEKLEWRPGLQTADVAQQPEWATSLGVDLGTVTGPESVPDWLGSAETKAVQSGTETIQPFEEASPLSTEPASKAESAVPDWMKEAGWNESQATGDQEGFLPLSETEGVEQELAPADIPDWLKTMAPSAGTEIPPETPPIEAPPATGEEIEQAAVLPWLEETPPGPTDSVSLWLEKQELAENVDEQLDLGPTTIENIPDWLQDLGEPAGKTTPQAAPEEQAEHEEFLLAEENEEDRSGIGPAAVLAAAAGLIAADEHAEEAEEELPEALAEDIQAEAVMSAGIADWLQELGTVDGELAPDQITADTLAATTTPSLEEPLAEAQIPDWLQNLQPVSDVQASQPLTADEISLSDNQVPVEEQLERAAPGPGMEAHTGDWETESSQSGLTEEASIGEAQTTTSGEAPSLDEDEAFAWLENLASRQGAEEALLLSPDERRETPPDWILSEASEQEAVQPHEDLGPGVLEAAVLAAALTDHSGDEQGTITSEQAIEPGAAEQPEPESLSEKTMIPEPEPLTAEVIETLEPASSELVTAEEIPAATEAFSILEPTAESEMLFYPLETAEVGAEPITLEEAPIAKGDTKPTAIKTTPIETMGVIAATTAVIEAVTSQDEEAEIAPSTPELEEMTSEPATIAEQPAFSETSEAGEEIPELAYKPEKPIAEGVVIPEEDEAFAWLESLAARQGAEEALLLAPEERLESPPEWVVQEAAEAEETQPVESPEAARLPAWLQEEPLIEQEAEGAVIPGEEVPDWLKQPAAIAEETPKEEELPPLAPELPTWLAGIEEAQKEAETAAWPPTEESYAGGGPVDVPEISEELPEAIEEAAPVPILDLNQAGLIDLERLPGIGFTRAQAILDYREQHGPYQEIDELLLVTGITPDMLLELKQYLTVGGTLVTAAAEPPAEDHQILLVQARNALVQGDIPLAVSRYGILIEKKEMLPDVITDLNEALYRFPIDVSIWEALGDAHLRAGHLQDALNAYTKAEEYLH